MDKDTKIDLAEMIITLSAVSNDVPGMIGRAAASIGLRLSGPSPEMIDWATKILANAERVQAQEPATWDKGRPIPVTLRPPVDASE